MVEAVSIVFTLATISMFLVTSSRKRMVHSWAFLSLILAAASIFIVLDNGDGYTEIIMVLLNLMILGLSAGLIVGRNRP